MSDTTKQFSLQGFRPDGFGYPTGLNVIGTANTTVDYLVVAGGGGGGGSAFGFAAGGGGGGAGGPDAIWSGGNGGSGIVIIRYSNAVGQKATGGTVTTSPGYVIHTFTGTGTFSTNNDFGANYSIN